MAHIFDSIRAIASKATTGRLAPAGLGSGLGVRRARAGAKKLSGLTLPQGVRSLLDLVDGAASPGKGSKLGPIAKGRNGARATKA